MTKKIKLRTMLLTLFLTAIIVPITYSKYTESKTKYITLNSREPRYTVVFNANTPTGATVTGSMSNQDFVYGTAQNLNLNNFEIENYSFSGWTKSTNGSGTLYTDNQLVNNLSEIDGSIVNLYANWVIGVAEIDGVFYDTLQEAINAVPTDNTLTTIKLLTNTTEDTIVSKNKNIVINLQNHTLTALGAEAAITNNGTLKISNGIVTSNSTAAATINNNQNANLIVDGARILMTSTGGKQALYNDKGTVEITGNSYLRSASGPGKNLRAAVQNQASSTLLITGGTIVSESYIGVDNRGNMTIGVEDNASNKLSPVIQGSTIGVSSTTNFAFYDGTAKGKNSSFNNVAKITSQEEDFMLVSATEVIDNQTYNISYLGVGVTITFDAMSGTSPEATRAIESGSAIGSLPLATRTGYRFDGWYTLPEGGSEVTSSTTFENDTTIFAHWTQTSVASVNGVVYTSLQTAINQATSGSTVLLIDDCIESVKVPNNKTITLDLQGHTLSNSGDASTIENNGTLEVYNGTITGNAATKATINNNATGSLHISGGNVISTGTRSAVYNIAGGYVEISGNAYLSATATGVPTTTALERATVQNLLNGTVKITGGTIVGVHQQAISNEGNLTIGDNTDGNLSTVSPEIQGKTYGIRSTVAFDFYDGVVKGITDAIDNEINVVQTDSSYSIVHGTETIGSDSYKTSYLEQ